MKFFFLIFLFFFYFCEDKPDEVVLFSWNNFFFFFFFWYVAPFKFSTRHSRVTYTGSTIMDYKCYIFIGVVN